tara:strand:- start:234 stop:434 length:201 start_codon:yes stop_codon:yes gene_type:complete
MTTKDLASGLDYYTDELNVSVSELVEAIKKVKSGEIDISTNELFDLFYEVQSVMESMDRDFTEALN